MDTPLHPDPSRVASRHLASSGIARFLPRDWPKEGVEWVQEIADELIAHSEPEHRSQPRKSKFSDAEILREVHTWTPLLFKRIEQGHYARDSEWVARMMDTEDTHMESEMVSAIKDYIDDLRNP